MRKLIFACICMGSLTLMAFTSSGSEILQTAQNENNDPCGCVADLVECLNNNNGPCFAAYKWCILNCGY